MWGWIKKPRQVEHGFCLENLSAYIDEQVNPRERARIDRHLAECAECRATLAELRATVALLRRAPMLQVPRSFAIPLSEGVRSRPRSEGERVERNRPPLTQRSRFTFGYLQLATSVATALLVLVVSGDLLLRSGWGATLQSTAPVPEATQRGVEEPLMAKSVEDGLAPTDEAGTVALMAPAPLPAAPGPSDNQVIATAGAGSPTEPLEASSDSQVLMVQSMPTETFSRPAGPPDAPSPTPDGAVASPVATEEETALPTYGATVAPTAAPAPTAMSLPTPMPEIVESPPDAGPVEHGPGESRSPVERDASAAPASDSGDRLATVRNLLLRLELTLGGLVLILLLLSLWLRRKQSAV